MLLLLIKIVCCSYMDIAMINLQRNYFSAHYSIWEQLSLLLNSPFWTASWGTKVIQTSFCQLKLRLGSVPNSLVCVCLPEWVEIELLLKWVPSKLHGSGICVIAIHNGVNAILSLSVSECPKVQLRPLLRNRVIHKVFPKQEKEKEKSRLLKSPWNQN